MKKLLLTIVVFLCGCSTTVTMFPTDGPLSQQSPLPVITATVHGIEGNSGEITMAMPDGEEGKGRWAVVAPQSTSATTSLYTGNMHSIWASVYGTSFTTQNLAGVNRGEAMVIGNKGRIIEVEFFVGSGTASGYGVAKDNKGNVYKLIF